MQRFIYKYTCDNCDEEIFGHRTLNLTDADNNEEIILDVDMLGGFELECPSCHHTYYIPDLREYVEDITEEIEEYEEDE